MSKISIIIVSFNDQNFLPACIESITCTSCNLDYEIIVVDNNSNVPTQEFLKPFNPPPRLQILRNELNEGFARAVNRGLSFATGDYYLLLNPDTEIYPDCLLNLMNFLETHPEASCAGPLIHSPSGGIERSTHGFPSLTKEFFHSLPFLKSLVPYEGFLSTLLSWIPVLKSRDNLASYWNYDRERVVDNITGACMMVRKKAVDEVGALDPNFWLYTEEVDWNLRFKKAGWKVYFTPQAEILHYFGQSTGQKPRAQKVNHCLIERYRGMIYFFNKHYGKKKTLLLRIIYIFAFTLRLMIAIFKLPFKGLITFKKEIRVFSQILKISLMGPLHPTLPIKEI